MLNINSNIYTTPMQGIKKATQKANVAAHNIANMNTPEAKALEVQDQITIQTDQDINPAKEIVHLMEAENSYKANGKVIQTADDMTGSLLDIMA